MKIEPDEIAEIWENTKISIFLIQNSIFLSCGGGSGLWYTKITIKTRGRRRGWQLKMQKNRASMRLKNQRNILTILRAFSIAQKRNRFRTFSYGDNLQFSVTANVRPPTTERAKRESIAGKPSPRCASIPYIRKDERRSDARRREPRRKTTSQLPFRKRAAGNATRW